MMLKFRLVTIAMVIVCMQSVFSQSKSVNGQVTDVSGLPIPGVTVLVENTSNGASTDFDGNYALNNVASTDNLVFSFVGYGTQKILVGDQTTINVVLIESSESLDEIVVIGYGTTKRGLVTGANVTLANIPRAW